MIHWLFAAYTLFCSIAILGRTGDYKVALWLAATHGLCYWMGYGAARRNQERDMYKENS